MRRFFSNILPAFTFVYLAFALPAHAAQFNANAVENYKRGASWFVTGDYDKSIAAYTKAISIEPSYVDAYDAIARIQATCVDERYRDGAKAFENANRAYQLDGGKSWGYIDSLAAAYAESGDFDKAKEWENKAIALASDKTTKETCRLHLETYKLGKPLREASPKTFHVSHKLFSIPFQVGPHSGPADPQPAEVQLFVSPDRGMHWDSRPWLNVAPEKGHFLFRAGSDGEYWFYVATKLRSGEVHPPSPPRVPGLRVIVDSNLPKDQDDIVREWKPVGDQAHP
jgi:tetratricopeptide (TPR) repeat protein